MMHTMDDTIVTIILGIGFIIFIISIAGPIHTKDRTMKITSVNVGIDHTTVVTTNGYYYTKLPVVKDNALKLLGRNVIITETDEYANGYRYIRTMFESKA